MICDVILPSRAPIRSGVILVFESAKVLQSEGRGEKITILCFYKRLAAELWPSIKPHVYE